MTEKLELNDQNIHFYVVHRLRTRNDGVPKTYAQIGVTRHNKTLVNTLPPSRYANPVQMIVNFLQRIGRSCFDATGEFSLKLLVRGIPGFLLSASFRIHLFV